MLTFHDRQLVRSELRLAQLEGQEKVTHAGIGVGLLGGAGVIGQRFESARRLSGNTGLFVRS
jgi:hypothetical protein